MAIDRTFSESEFEFEFEFETDIAFEDSIKFIVQPRRLNHPREQFLGFHGFWTIVLFIAWLRL